MTEIKRVLDLPRGRTVDACRSSLADGEQNLRFGTRTVAHILSDPSELRGLKEEWNSLSAKHGSPLLDFEWSQACAEALCSKSSPLTTFVIRSNGRLRAIAPMITARYAGIPQLEMLGSKFGEPSGFIYDDDEALTLLLQAILKSRKPFVMNRFDVSSPELARLIALLSKTSYCRMSDGGSSPWVPLKSNWAEFEASMSSGRRSDLRRYRRKAERIGEVEFQVVTPTQDTLAPYMREVFRIEASGWKGKAQSAILNCPHLERFYTLYAKAAVELGTFRLFFLKIGGRTAAMRMAVEHGNRLWDLKIGYDPDFRECSPGILMTHETLRYASQQGLSAHEFLGRAEHWETIWTSVANRYVSPRVYPLSFNGGLSVAQDTVRFLSRRAGAMLNRPDPGKATC